MDSSRHGYQTQHTGKDTAWTAVNRSLYQADDSPKQQQPLQPLPPPPPPPQGGGPVAMQSTIPAMSVIRPGGNQFRPMVANTPRALLPRPHPSLKSPSKPKPCLVCGRSSCALDSHKFWVDHALARQKAKQATPLSKGKTPVRTPQTQPRPPDQFVHYPVTMDSEKHQFLSLWSQDWGRMKRGPERHLFPVRWIDRVLPTAMRHAALFQALLATSASMWAMAHTTLSEATTRNLQLADQILGQACPNSDIAKGDECLMAALMITIVHQAQGNRHETDRHFRNIVGLVGVAEGPQYRPMSPMSSIVADLLFYVDFLQAVMVNCEPVWRLPLPALQIGISPRLGHMFREMMHSNVVSIELLRAADSICRTTDIFEQPAGTKRSDASAMNSFGYLSTISEYQLAHCNAIFHGSSTSNECICLALLLFNYIVLRNDGAVTSPVRYLERQFWETIDRTILRGGLAELPPCLLLWLYITGLSSCILSDCQYRSTAVKRMRAANISAAISGWDHFQQKVLDNFVWMRTAQEETFRGVWREVEVY